jgi:hypothetical protein
MALWPVREKRELLKIQQLDSVEPAAPYLAAEKQLAQATLRRALFALVA